MDAKGAPVIHTEALAILLGQTPPSYLALATTLTASALFIAVAVWAFERQDI